MAKYESVAQIVSDAAVELGLVSADIADPFASTDANTLFLLKLLTKIGRRLVSEYEWPQLRRTATISLVNGTSTYDLPADFGRMINQTGWNRTSRLPLGGPISAQAWEYFQAIGVAATLTVLFRAGVFHVNDGGTPPNPADDTFREQIEVYPTPTTSQTVALEYISGYWLLSDSAANGASATPTSDRVTTSVGIPVFPSSLLVAALKLAFRREKGFDTTTAQADYDEALESAKGAFPAPVLSLTPNTDYPPLRPIVPPTGFGA